MISSSKVSLLLRKADKMHLRLRHIEKYTENMGNPLLIHFIPFHFFDSSGLDISQEDGR